MRKQVVLYILYLSFVLIYFIHVVFFILYSTILPYNYIVVSGFASSYFLLLSFSIFPHTLRYINRPYCVCVPLEAHPTTLWQKHTRRWNFALGWGVYVGSVEIILLVVNVCGSGCFFLFLHHHPPPPPPFPVWTLTLCTLYPPLIAGAVDGCVLHHTVWVELLVCLVK